ncbi:MAG: transporter [Ekhidna sp.]|nr:transporter [Ekhidna sp.]MBC6411213.1 transporter [Ekhidna sp.]MBC6426573.1 transporter [Ekhidna sp.]
MKKIILVFLLSAFSIVSFAGGGWNKKKGTGYFKLSQYAIIADQYFNPEGRLTEVSPRISFYNTAFYGEYGLTDRITSELYFPFFSRSVLNSLKRRNGEVVEGDRVSSLGDTNVSFKYGIDQEGSTVVSVKLTLGIPLGNASGGETGTLQTGDGEFNQMISIDVGHSFYPAPFYANASVGLNNRTKGFSEEFRYSIEAGLTLKKFVLIGRITSVHSFFNADTSDNASQGVFGNNIEYMSLMPELVYKIKENCGITAAVGTAFSGKQVLANPSYELGFFFEL